MRRGGELEGMLGLAAAIFGIELSHTLTHCSPIPHEGYFHAPPLLLSAFGVHGPLNMISS